MDQLSYKSNCGKKKVIVEKCQKEKSGGLRAAEVKSVAAVQFTCFSAVQFLNFFLCLKVEQVIPRS